MDGMQRHESYAIDAIERTDYAERRGGRASSRLEYLFKILQIAGVNLLAFVASRSLTEMIADAATVKATNPFSARLVYNTVYYGLVRHVSLFIVGALYNALAPTKMYEGSNGVETALNQEIQHMKNVTQSAYQMTLRTSAKDSAFHLATSYYVFSFLQKRFPAVNALHSGNLIIRTFGAELFAFVIGTIANKLISQIEPRIRRLRKRSSGERTRRRHHHDTGQQEQQYDNATAPPLDDPEYEIARAVNRARAALPPEIEIVIPTAPLLDALEAAAAAPQQYDEATALDNALNASAREYAPQQLPIFNPTYEVQLSSEELHDLLDYYTSEGLELPHWIATHSLRETLPPSYNEAEAGLPTYKEARTQWLSTRPFLDNITYEEAGNRLPSPQSRLDNPTYEDARNELLSIQSRLDNTTYEEAGNELLSIQSRLDNTTYEEAGNELLSIQSRLDNTTYEEAGNRLRPPSYDDVLREKEAEQPPPHMSAVREITAPFDNGSSLSISWL